MGDHVREHDRHQAVRERPRRRLSHSPPTTLAAAVIATA